MTTIDGISRHSLDRRSALAHLSSWGTDESFHVVQLFTARKRDGERSLKFIPSFSTFDLRRHHQPAEFAMDDSEAIGLSEVSVSRYFEPVFH